MDELPSDSPTVASPLPSVAGLVAGRYRVRSRLGRGATKEVYLAYDERLDREVALAIVVGAADDVAARARVTREAQVTGRLGDHPNIITIYDTGEIDRVPYLVMRAMSGGSLADLLARERPPLERTIRVCREIALALAHAHAHGVVHRDVKPDNVWLAADGSAALGDFGIAHRAGSDRLTAEGMVLGTVRYLSPEQIRGADVGPASDLYALGVTLYELVCGRAPFLGSDPMQVLTQHLTTPPVAPSQHEPGVPEALERLILELLAKTPQERPASAAEVASVLADIAATMGSLASGGRGSIAQQTRRHDALRLVTVLAVAADIADPEALHGTYEHCIATIERHGGNAERLLGDALVAFFGLTASHGDDALRAARTAVELSASTPALRFGIESGELFLGAGPHGATVATGAAIREAGKLAEGAAAGEILLGDRVRRAVAADARIDDANGRLLELHAERPALLRAPATPFVGRARELGELRAHFEHVRDGRGCRLVTIVGAPGIGKSRLARELLAGLGDDATILTGRCLAYGEGTTYRAIAELVRDLGDDPRTRVQELLAGDEQAIRGILSVLGLSDEPAHAEETSLALRRLLERLARDGPLVVGVEDIHWAEPVLLDMLDHVVALSSGWPILLVCLARPELLEARPAWAAPQPNRFVQILEALGDADALELAERLGAGELAGRIAQRAEGNPLFVEQLVAVDAGQDTGELPASIQGVLAARIDALDPDERELLQRAAVEGRTFHGGSLAAMLPAHERRAMQTRLVALARKGLIGADGSRFAGEDAFRFGHALIRDAAYAGLPKHARAEMHACVAEWLEQRPDAADEIVGYHLEQACVLAAALGRDGEAERTLATHAVESFRRAANTALARDDASAASGLLQRAVTLVESDVAARGALLPALGASLFEAGRIAEATQVLDEAIAVAPDTRLQARAQTERELIRLETETETGNRMQLASAVADDVLPVLAGYADEAGRSRAWSLRAHAAWTTGQASRADDAWMQAAECARNAGDELERFTVLRWRATAAAYGPTRVGEAIGRCEEFREVVAASPVALAWTYKALAVLHAMRGDFDVAQRLLGDANAMFNELGTMNSSVSHHDAHVHLLAGQPDRAEVSLRDGIQRLAAIGDSRVLATSTAMLAQAVYAQGRMREADALCEATADAAAADDILTQVIWRSVRAKILVHDGDCDAAAAVARGALSEIETTDFIAHHGDALLDLGEVLAACSEPDAARDALRAGLALHERKGNLAGVTRARAQLLGLG